jgi:hypothetical protein
MVRNHRRGLGYAAVLVAVGASVACSQGVADDPGERTEVDGQPLVGNSPLPAAAAARLGALDTHAGVVQGVVEVRAANGTVLGTRGVTNVAAPANLDELMETGGVDADGYAYTDVSGAQGDGTYQTRYAYVKRYKPETTRNLPSQPTPIKPAARSAGVVVTKSYQKALDDPDKKGEVEIYIRLKGGFTSKLKPSSARALTSLHAAEQDYVARHGAIANRKAEADGLQASVKHALQQLGAHGVGGFWTSNAVSAHIPKSALQAVLAIPGIERVEVDQEAPPASATQWDGDDMKAPGGMNAGIYHDAGYHGQAYANAGGRHMRVGMYYSDGWFEHPGFEDDSNGPTRASVYDCSVSPCVANQSKSGGPGAHDLKCGGLAAGSLRQNQIAGMTDQEELERSGPAEEPEIHFLEGTSSSSAKRAIELAIDLELDFLSGSRGSPVACDGQGSSDIEDSVMAAQLANIIVVNAAGNEGHSGGCSLVDPVDTPPFFAVGGVGSGSNTCTSSNYSTCAGYSSSSRGGIDATINGSTSPAALSGVAVSAPACPQYYYTSSSPWIHTYSGSTTCGTSYAAPQVAGAAALMKDYFLANSETFITIEGRPFVVMLAMGDRQGESGKVTTGFDPVWGAGRFQMRRFDGSDHAGVWGWESYSSVFSGTGPSEHSLWGSGTESASLNQAKVYMHFFEKDAEDIAKIDLRVRADNCAGASLGLDSSDDVKKMVRMDTSAAGQALCARLNAIHMPAGESRRAHVFAYYSGDTAMR